MSLFKEQSAIYQDKIEQALVKYLPPTDGPQKEVVEAMGYSLCGGGKRIRAMLVLAFYELFGGKDLDAALPFAASVEMIHAYSLIHDDLPCMDDDDLRRGKPSCHIAYGEAIALLAGDGLLNLTFETLSHPDNGQYFTAPQVLECISMLSYATGAEGMIGGQVMDLANEGKQVSDGVLKDTDHLKTGALITAAADMGSILGGATFEERQYVWLYGEKIGLAFQIMDDILDVTSTAEALGKPINSDIDNQKSTYTSIYGVEKATQIVEELTNEALSALEHLGLEHTEFLVELTRYLSQRNK